MSGFNSHQLRAVPAAVIARCQNCRCISTRLVLSVREKMFCSSDQGYIMNVFNYKFDVQSLYGCTTQPTGKFVQFSTYPETNEKAFLEFGASLCHRYSKKLVVKSRRKLTLLLKRQNSPEVQAKQKQHADRCGNDTFA